MASSGNIATLNPLHKMSSGTFSNGNLKYVMSSSESGYVANISMTKKSYCEVRVDAQSNNGGSIGIRSGQCNEYYTDTLTFQTNYSSGDLYLYKNTSGTDVGDIGGVVSTGAIVMMAYDPETYKWWVGVNGTWRSSGNPATGANPTYTGSATMFEDMNDIFWGGWTSGANGLTVTFNFGQDSTFGGQETAGGNADGNGFGDFKYAPPTGFLCNSSGNIDTSDDIDPALTDDNYPAKNFNVVLFDGNGSTNAVTGLGFKPDLIWGFTRSAGQSKRMVDSTRGGSERVHSDTGNAASTGTVVISAFGSDGFTANGGQFNNDNGATCGAWCWKAAGGTTANNTSGSIDSVTQANVEAGFSIITYTGSGSNGTIGHGLSAAPDFFMVKDRARAESWNVYHSGIGATKYLVLDTNAHANTNSNRWNNTEPTASLIGLGTNDNTNGSSTYICYAWHNVEGYSRFGTYKGNGNTNGPFIYTGFRPRLLAIKAFASNYGEGWIVHDTARTTANTSIKKEVWNDGTGESTAPASHQLDFLSNGFKCRNTNTDFNESGSSYVYMAWGDVPFKYNNTF